MLAGAGILVFFHRYILHTLTHAHTYTHTLARTHTRWHTHTLAYTHARVHTHTPTHARARAYIHSRSCICTCTNMPIGAQDQVANHQSHALRIALQPLVHQMQECRCVGGLVNGWIIIGSSPISPYCTNTPHALCITHTYHTRASYHHHHHPGSARETWWWREVRLMGGQGCT
jgi:hypothetical protein